MEDYAKLLEPLLSLREMSQLLGLSERGLKMMALKGTVPAFKPGGKVWRFRPSDVFAAMQRNSFPIPSDSETEV